MAGETEIVRVDLLVPLATTPTTVGSNDVVIPCGGFESKVTFPENPSRLVTAIRAEDEVPAEIVRSVGIPELRLKSPRGATCFAETLTDWLTE